MKRIHGEAVALIFDVASSGARDLAVALWVASAAWKLYG
jgi:hypothetical protein